MALVNYAASLQGVALRLSRLDEAGNPMTGPNNCYVTKAFMRVSFTPEYEEGDETTEKNAAGEVCVTYKAPDTLKRATMEIAICEPDPEITELLTGGVLLNMPADFADAAIAGATVGYAAVRVGESGNTNGVGVEVWSLAIRDGGRDNTMPYFRWVFPRATLRPSGDRVIENGLLANTFEGWSVGNLNFGTGPLDDWPWPDATDRPFLYARDVTTAWAGQNGWVDTTGSVTDVGAVRFLGDGSVNPEYSIENESDLAAPDVYEAELDLLGATGATGLAVPPSERGARTQSGPSPQKPVQGPVLGRTSPASAPGAETPASTGSSGTSGSSGSSGTSGSSGSSGTSGSSST